MCVFRVPALTFFAANALPCPLLPNLPNAGVVCQPPLPTGQLRAVRSNDRSLSGCGRHVDALKQLAASYWGLPKHPGWTLAPEQPVRANTHTHTEGPPSCFTPSVSTHTQQGCGCVLKSAVSCRLAGVKAR